MTMPNPDDGSTRRRAPRLPLRILNFTAIALSIALFAGFLLVFIIEAFTSSFLIGIQSLAASLVPLLYFTYIAFYTELFKPTSKIPTFNVFFIFTIWTLIAFIVARVFYTSVLPISEVVFSFTLGWVISISQHTNFQIFISSAYGIILGFLIYLAFFSFWTA